MSKICKFGRRLKSPKAEILLMLLSLRTRWEVVVGMPLGMSSRPRWEQSTLVASHLIRKSPYFSVIVATIPKIQLPAVRGTQRVILAAMGGSSRLACNIVTLFQMFVTMGNNAKCVFYWATKQIRLWPRSVYLYHGCSNMKGSQGGLHNSCFRWIGVGHFWPTNLHFSWSGFKLDIFFLWCFFGSSHLTPEVSTGFKAIHSTSHEEVQSQKNGFRAKCL